MLHHKKEGWEETSDFKQLQLNHHTWEMSSK